jgi:hypothetical protein
MKYIFILIYSFVAVSFSSYAQESPQLKRTPYKLTVAVDKNSVYEADIQAIPYVLPDNTVQLYPGETVYIEVEQENGIIKRMTAVKEIKDSSKTLTISFAQSARKEVHELMTLKVTNPFPNNLIYKANIFLLRENKWANTDVYPVEAGLSGFETWPDIITSIGLGDWKFQIK